MKKSFFRKDSTRSAFVRLGVTDIRLDGQSRSRSGPGSAKQAYPCDGRLARFRSAGILSLVICLAACQTLVEPPGPKMQPGSIVPPYPAGVGDVKGTCIGVNRNHDPCEYSLGILEDRNAMPFLLAVEKLEKRDAKGKPVWRVLDSLPYPRHDGTTVFEYASCRYRGRDDDTVMALVPAHDESSPEYIGAKNWAYKVNLSSGRLEKVDPAQVDCANTMIGAE